ncbi:Glycine--tRNA ligase 1, mitochondrial [Sorochytrium milnesiophthora]
MSDTTVNRAALDNLLTRRFFFAPAFEIYGGQAGLYDYGPPGCALQANFIDQWRKHFVLEEDMLEIDSTILTPHDVLKTSGHVDRFCDWMCKDVKTGDIFRADHLLENVLSARLEGDKRARQTAEEQQQAAAGDAEVAAGVKEKKSKKKAKVVAVKLDDTIRTEYESILAQIDNYSGPELGQLIAKFDVRTPEANNPVTEPVEFNLMFDTAVGPSGLIKGYLRPETAQGQFVNFGRLLEFNNGRMPFASAQIGRSFRNEISPRQGLIRVREFLMGEIEHYVDPLNKDHPNFDSVKDVVLNLLPASVQLSGRTDIVQMTIGDAVQKGIVDNKTLGYFLARIHLFLNKIGVNNNLLRFRQHMQNEMAHYACDCWDAELKSSFGWIECVGCADRSAYDLTRHTERTGQKLVVRQTLAEPRVVTKLVANIDKKVFGPAFKKDAKAVEEALLAMDQLQLTSAQSDLATKGKTLVAAGPDGVSYEVATHMAKIEQVTIKEHVREYTPNVIEPSFGIGRILYTLLEHVYYARENDEERGVLAFPACMAPVKCLLVPLSNHESFAPVVKSLSAQLRRRAITTRVDDSANSIGRRYARNDELGTPFAVTVDFQTLKDDTITLRERDSTAQIREKTETILEVLKALVEESTTWTQVSQKYKTFTQQEA